MVPFFLESEGHCPDHILVIHGGRFFVVRPFDDGGRQPWSEARLENCFVEIEQKVETSCCSLAYPVVEIGL